MTARRALLLATLACVAVPPAGAQARPDDPADSLIASAGRAIAEGRPWQATRLLAALAAGPDASPAARLTAARAATHWDGWSTVIRLLQGASWLDRTPDGDGRALLARALLEHGQPSEAIRHSPAAIAAATDDATRGARLVIHARALDRLGRFDSAAAAYRTAAGLLPDIADWLNLRAAGIERDSATRAALFAAVTSAPARRRIPWTEAIAYERLGDWRRAAERYASVGADLAAVRLRLANGDSALRAATRSTLSDLMAGSLPNGESGEAIRLFDRHFPRRTAVEELRIARRAAGINNAERAVAGFTAAGKLVTDRDRFRLAAALARAGRAADAMTTYDAVQTPGLKADAAYQKARLRIRSGGDRGAATRALLAIPASYPDDSTPAATALFLLADLYADRGADDSARMLFREAGTRYPLTSFGQRSAFQAALIAYLDGNLAAAASEFDVIAAGRGEEAAGARYFAGRALYASGDTVGARQRWQETLARHGDSYYGWRASRRLGTTFRVFPEAARAADDSIDRAPLRRARALEAVGMRTESRFELAAFVSGYGSDRGTAVVAGRALSAGDWHAEALRMGQRALDRGALFDRTLAELLYPLPFRDVLTAEAEASGVDPMLVAAVIRQESAFDPTARSVADARGLMQVLPSVGGQLARRAGLPEWDPVLLYQPDVNLDFGIEHLAEALERLEWPERALAAYNAGQEPVGRWQAIRGVTLDPEVFVERIPFAETRDYVRKVLRNYAMYTALHRAPAP